jgi:hypothetical protein
MTFLKYFFKQQTKLLWANLILQVLDGLSTSIALRHGLHESNRLLHLLASTLPFDSGMHIAVWMSKVMVSCGLIIYWKVIGQSQSDLRHRNGLFACLALVMIAVISWNISNLGQH